MRALERQHQFEPGSRIDHWIFQIARSIWLNDLRSQRVRDASSNTDPDELESGAQSPEQSALMDQVYRAVMTLPDPQREVIVLVYIEGFSYAETAKLMEIPIGTVMSRLATSRRKLSAALNQPDATLISNPPNHGTNRMATRNGAIR